MAGVMTASDRVRRVRARWTPADVLRLWPLDRPLACVVSGNESGGRWSIFATPTRVERCAAEERDPMGRLEALFDRAKQRTPTAAPFVGGWMGWLSFDLGRVIEPSARAGAKRCSLDDRAWPLFEMFECPGAYMHDAARGEWFVVGDSDSLPQLDTHEPGIRRPGAPGPVPGVTTVSGFTSRTGRDAFEGSVARAVEYIRAGDVFQVNLAHRLSARFEGSPRALAWRLLSSASPAYGAYMESPDDSGGVGRAIISISPELFLEYEPRSRRVVTRPIKGTRAEREGAASELRRSAKDEAELTMIVDLMRNDLGRVCEFRSVRVDEPRRIEAHPRLGVVHGVATVSGRLRRGVSHAGLLTATFPPGSVTGAPKIRAMQIIDALEPVRRGPYCGAVGFVSDSGHAAWNVAIRTACLTCEPGGIAQRAKGVIDYSVGAGIVAESEPAKEWEETLDKARVLRLIGVSEVGEAR